MKPLRRYCLMSVGLFVLIVLVSACSGGSDESSKDQAAAPAAPGVSERTEAGEQTTVASFESTNSTLLQDEQSVTTQRLIIKNSDLRLQVADASVATVQVTDIATRYGGYVLQSTANNQGESRTATITVAVEVAHFETAVEDIQALAEDVVSVSTSGEDVTAEYVDAESRLRNLEATRDRVRTFLEQTKNVEEALAVNIQLSQIEGEIEQVKGRMNYLAGRAAYSTITVHLQEEKPAPKSKKGWSPGSTIEDAIKFQGDLLRGLVDLSVWLVIVAGPYLVAVGLVFVFVRRWSRR